MREELMAQVCYLSKAPITEAIIDFRVAVMENISFEAIESYLQSIDFGYYKKGPIVRGKFDLQVNADAVLAAQVLPNASSATVGVRMHSSDEKYVAQFFVDRFSLSRLEPYENWDAMLQEAQRLWPMYVSAVHPHKVTRVATRFINNLRLPLQNGDSFGKYLTQQPNYPDEIPQAVSSFLQRFVMHETVSGAVIIVTHALEDSPFQGNLPVIVDIDAFKNGNYAPEGADMWTCLEGLRVLKNKFFFASLTEEAVELYK